MQLQLRERIRRVVLFQSTDARLSQHSDTFCLELRASSFCLFVAPVSGLASDHLVLSNLRPYLDLNQKVGTFQMNTFHMKCLKQPS